MKVKHTCFAGISQERIDAIKGYNTRDLTSQRFSDPKSWVELAAVMTNHPHPVTRHEACFLAAELQIPYVHRLVAVVKFDVSIVNKHEAAESLGKVMDRDDAWMSYVFLSKTTKKNRKNFRYDSKVYHPDVQATILESITELEERFPDFKNRTISNAF